MIICREGGRARHGSAIELKIGVTTTEAHRQNLMNKLGMHSIVDLMRFTIREGLGTARKDPETSLPAGEKRG